jgi:opacity protein-like surface antigen
MRSERKTQRRRAAIGARAAALALAALTVPGPAAQAQESETEVLLTGYLFASALDGRASVTSTLPPADIELSFSDVLEDLDFGVMSALELRRGKWSFVGDLMYSRVSPSGSVPTAPPLGAALEQRSLTLQGTVYFRVHEDANLFVDLGAGLRRWSVDNTAAVSLGGVPVATFADSEDWVDPVVAARMNARLGEATSLTLAADYGSFGGGSDETWQLLGTLNWQKSDRVTLRAGYRVLSVDHLDNGFVYDVRMNGPVFGMTYRF